MNKEAGGRRSKNGDFSHREGERGGRKKERERDRTREKEIERESGKSAAFNKQQITIHCTMNNVHCAQ